MALFAAALTDVADAQTPFRRVEIERNAGDVKAVADIDLDGTLDVVLGGMPAEGLNWYHYPEWTETRLATPATEFTTDGSVGDVDGDGDPDIVVPDGASGQNLRWFENPTRSAGGARGNPFAAGQWRQRVIGAVGSWCKDVELADFDRNGLLDVAARRNDQAMIFFQTSPGAFVRRDLDVTSLGTEGMASGDVDKDGDTDLIVRGAWLENPGASSRTASFSEHVIDASAAVSGSFKALVTDLDRDGAQDVLFSSSESTADVAWYAHAGNPRGTWTRHVIAASVLRAHTLQVADMDQDGDPDVVVGQMHTTSTRELNVYYNVGGTGRSWTAQLIDQSYGIHNGVVADLGADGDYEVVGSNWTGNPPLQFWENLTPQPDQRLGIEPLVGGQRSLCRVSNARPGTLVVLCATAGGTTTPYLVPGFGATLRLDQPLILLYGLARSNGVFDANPVVPAIFRSIKIRFQAIGLGRSSNVVTDTVR